MNRTHLEFAAYLARRLPDYGPANNSASCAQIADMVSQIISLARKHRKLCDAICNGDWPAWHYEASHECPKCEHAWRTKACPLCRIEKRLASWSSATSIKLALSRDPRGATVALCDYPAITYAVPA